MRKALIPAPAIAPASALIWWIVGYLPWLLDGAGDDVNGIDAYSFAEHGIALPLLTTELPLLVLGGLVGGICAGLLTTLSDGGRATTLAASFAGVACAVLLAGFQSTSVLDDAERGYASDTGVLSALLITTAFATLLGWLFGAGGCFGRVPFGIAFCVLAGALPSWLGNLMWAVAEPMMRSEFGSQLIGYLAAALLTAGLVAIGVRPYVRLLAWPAAIVLAWIVMPALTATGYLAATLGPRVTLSDALGPAWDVVPPAANPANAPEVWIVPFLVAIGLALAISIRLEMRRRPTDPTGTTEAGPHSPVEPSSSSRTTSR